MQRFASAYGRALFPRRFGPHGGDSSDAGSPGERRPMELAPGGMEIAMSAGIYRAVVAVEARLDRSRLLLAEWRARPVRRAGNTPVNCG